MRKVCFNPYVSYDFVAMQDADAVLGHIHKKTLELMQQHQEKRFNVDANTQRGTCNLV